MPVCPSCDNNVPEKGYIESYVAPFNNQEYKLYHCHKCDLQWWEPLKVVLEFYEQEGNEYYEMLHSGLNKHLGGNHKTFFDNIPLKSGKLLDVGCGDGLFITKAQELGYEVWGIDFDRKNVQTCTEKRGLKNVFHMTLEDFVKSYDDVNSKFDIITFFEVLEHQENPRMFMELIKKLLKPGGWIAGSVPNRESLIQIMLRNKGSFDDYPPNHLLYFNQRSLENLLKSTGFVNINIKTKFQMISTLTYSINLLIFGEKLIKKIRKKFIEEDYDSGMLEESEKTKINLKRALFFSVKSMKNLIVIPISFALQPFFKNYSIYFQAKIN